MGEHPAAPPAAAASIPAKLAVQSYLQPHAVSSDAKVLSPSLGGMARKGGTITSTGGQQQLDVKYHCLKPGEAIVTVIIPMEIYEDVTFSYRKVCNKAPVAGLNVGTSPSDDDVVSEGQPWVYFDSQPGADGKRMVVDGSTPATTFFVWLKPLKCKSTCNPQQLAAATNQGKPESCHEICNEDTVDFKEPHVKAEPEICSPRIGGEMRKGGQLSSDGPMPLTIRYNCHAPGETVITVRIAMEDGTHDDVVWSWRKASGNTLTRNNLIESSELDCNLIGVAGHGKQHAIAGGDAATHGKHTVDGDGLPTHLIPL